jgi:hypothetical protein
MQPEANVQPGPGLLDPGTLGEQPLEMVPEYGEGAHLHRVVGQRQHVRYATNGHQLEVLVRPRIHVGVSVDRDGHLV